MVTKQAGHVSGEKSQTRNLKWELLSGKSGAPMLLIMLHSVLRSKLLLIFHLLITSHKLSVLGRHYRERRIPRPIDSKLI